MMDDDSMLNGGRSDATLWKVVAQFTRENNERDVKAAQALQQLDALKDKVLVLDTMLRDSMKRREKLQDQLTDIERRMDRMVSITEPQSHLLRRLDDVIKQRGSLELLSENEVDEIRALLRRLPDDTARYAQLRRDLDDLSAWKTSTDSVESDRRAKMHDIDNRLSDFDSWRAAHKEQVREMQHGIETLKGAAHSDAVAHELRAAYEQWQEFHTEYEPILVELAKTLKQKRSTAEKVRESLAVNWRAQLIGATVALLILVPGSQIVITVVHRIFGGG